MAFDSLLLEHCQSSSNPGPVLRFYFWNGSWLSLGRHQTRGSSHWNRLVRDGHLQLVRRPSGGSAVLHGGSLTYALIWPNPPRKRREAYRCVNTWLCSGLKRLGLELRQGIDPAFAENPNCFARATAADLVDISGQKRIGSAQFWQRGHLLQHGEIPLNPPKQLWHEIFGTAPPSWDPLPPSPTSVETALTEAVMELWPGLDWKMMPISPLEQEQVRERSAAYRVEESEVSWINPEARNEVTA